VESGRVFAQAAKRGGGGSAVGLGDVYIINISPNMNMGRVLRGLVYQVKRLRVVAAKPLDGFEAGTQTFGHGRNPLAAVRKHPVNAVVRKRRDLCRNIV